MQTKSDSNTSLLGPLIGWIIVHVLAVAGMFSHTDGTPFLVDDLEYRWFFVAIYTIAGSIPIGSYLRERGSVVPSTPALSMAIAFGFYVFLIGAQLGLLPIDDVRLITGGWAALGGGICLIVFNRRLQRIRQAEAKLDEDALVRRIAAAVRTELQS